MRIEIARAELRAAEDDIAKEVRVAMSNRTYTYARLAMAGRLLAQASLAYDLAKSRFDLGLSSIVDLNQADLNRTSAALTESTDKQDYLIQQAILANRLGDIIAPEAPVPVPAP
jgi:outer membrane protein